jgi:hypothetical protein
VNNFGLSEVRRTSTFSKPVFIILSVISAAQAKTCLAWYPEQLWKTGVACEKPGCKRESESEKIEKILDL